MASSSFPAFSFIYITTWLLVGFCSAEDPFVNFDLVVTYTTASPLGVPQQVMSFSRSLSLILCRPYLCMLHCIVLML